MTHRPIPSPHAARTENPGPRYGTAVAWTQDGRQYRALCVATSPELAARAWYVSTHRDGEWWPEGSASLAELTQRAGPRGLLPHEAAPTTNDPQPYGPDYPADPA